VEASLKKANNQEEQVTQVATTSSTIETGQGMNHPFLCDMLIPEAERAALEDLQ